MKEDGVGGLDGQSKGPVSRKPQNNEEKTPQETYGQFSEITEEQVILTLVACRCY